MSQSPHVFRQVIRNTGFQGLTFGSLALSNILIVIAIGRLAGPDKLGSFSFAITLTLFGLVFGDLGIGILLTREVSRPKPRPEDPPAPAPRRPATPRIPETGATQAFLCWR